VLVMHLCWSTITAAAAWDGNTTRCWKMQSGSTPTECALCLRRNLNEPLTIILRARAAARTQTPLRCKQRAEPLHFYWPLMSALKMRFPTSGCVKTEFHYSCLALITLCGVLFMRGPNLLAPARAQMLFVCLQAVGCRY
jgi:hypothetical protein